MTTASAAVIALVPAATVGAFVLNSCPMVADGDYQHRDLISGIQDEHQSLKYTEFCEDTALEFITEYFDEIDENQEFDYYADQGDWSEPDNVSDRYNAEGEPW